MVLPADLKNLNEEIKNNTMWLISFKKKQICRFLNLFVYLKTTNNKTKQKPLSVTLECLITLNAIYYVEKYKCKQQ